MPEVILALVACRQGDRGAQCLDRLVPPASNRRPGVVPIRATMPSLSVSGPGNRRPRLVVRVLGSRRTAGGVSQGTQVSSLVGTMTGTIRTLRVDKGFGFIKDDAGKEYFFHQSAVYGEGLENLREGDSVEFDVGQGPKGPRAENVRRTST